MKEGFNVSNWVLASGKQDCLDPSIWAQNQKVVCIRFPHSWRTVVCWPMQSGVNTGVNGGIWYGDVSTKTGGGESQNVSLLVSALDLVMLPPEEVRR